jgi:esterase/lipase superfamily enzyme
MGIINTFEDGVPVAAEFWHFLGLEERHLIAHSRGTDVLTSALRELYIETQASGKSFRTVYHIKTNVSDAPSR